MNLTFDISGNGEIYLDVLKTICGDTNNKSMIDLGSGNAPSTRQLGFTFKTYVDIVNRDIQEENKFFEQRDILEMVKENVFPAYDVSISLDNLEHYYKDDALNVLEWVQNNSAKQIIFTPLGKYCTIEVEGNKDPDTHKSGWTDEEFEAMGWATITFPHYHQLLGGLGAFFAWHCDNIEQDFERVKNELKNKSWTK